MPQGGGRSGPSPSTPCTCCTEALDSGHVVCSDAQMRYLLEVSSLPRAASRIWGTMVRRAPEAVCLPSAGLLIGVLITACEGERPTPRAQAMAANQAEIHIVDDGDGLPACSWTSHTNAERHGIRVDQQAACSVVARKVTSLTPDSSGSRPDPHYASMARDSEGNFYTGSRSGSNVLLRWSAEGALIATIGSPGQGPGEFDDDPRVWIDQNDTIIANAAGRISIFDPAGNFVRALPASSIGRFNSSTHILDTGDFLTSAPVVGGDRSHLFHVTDPNGRIVRSFGPNPAGETGAPLHGGIVPSGYAGGTTVWTAIPGESGYVLQEWDLDGRLSRTVRRDARWFQPDEDTGSPFIHVFKDPSGLLWIVSKVKDPRWRRIDDPRDLERLNAELYDLYLDVVDPRLERLVATHRLDDGSYSPVFQFVPRSGVLTYRPRFDAAGLATIEIFEMRLVPRTEL